MSTELLVCSRCRRTQPVSEKTFWDDLEIAAWAIQLKGGRISGVVCPGCQTPFNHRNHVSADDMRAAMELAQARAELEACNKRLAFLRAGIAILDKYDAQQTETIADIAHRMTDDDVAEYQRVMDLGMGIVNGKDVEP